MFRCRTSPRYLGSELLREAREVFADTVLPRDFDTIEVFKQAGESSKYRPVFMSSGGRDYSDLSASRGTENGDHLSVSVSLGKDGELNIVPKEAFPDLTAALIHSPLATMNARIERLVDWNEARRVPHQQQSPWYGLAAAVATVAFFAVTYSQLLVHIHTATEWLVR